MGGVEPTAPAELLEHLGLDAAALAACRRSRGVGFDGRIEQLERARLLRRLRWSPERLDMLAMTTVSRDEGRDVLVAAFGPANRERLEVYWDALHEHCRGGRFWLYEFLRAFMQRSRSP